MTATPRHSGARKGEVPNLGVFRPPLIYLASIVVGLAFQWMWPRPLLSGVALGPLGVALVVVSILVLGASVRRFRAAGTPVPARKPTTTIVRTGPYRFSRNPIYLGFSLLHLGIAMWVNSWWLVATLAAAVAIIHYVVIPEEERYLEAKFGTAYLDYKVSVRRWL
jgi:protein-S-isoprenylcysteine O-methyltransferase Ste14